MATHDYVLANASGAAFRADLNNALAAIVSNNSSATEPATTYAYMWWADTTNGQLKLRNAANDDWVVIQELDGTLLMKDGTVSDPGLAFADDLDTGLFRPSTNQLAIATNGVERIEFGTSEVVVNDGGADVDFRVEGDTEANLLVVDAGNDRIGIAESAPSTLVEIGSETPYVTLKNSTEEDTDGGRESRLIFEGEQSGGEISSLAQIEVSHDGTADDEKGKLIISTNDGSDGAAPTTAVTIDSDQNVTIAGNLTASGINYPSDGALSGARNRIINGDMRIDQRNAGASVTANTTANVFTLDRWAGYGQLTDGVFTVQQSTSSPPTGFTHFLRATTTTADASIGATQTYGLRYVIEGNNISDFAFGSASAKQVTLSFWVRSSLTGTFGGSIANDGNNRFYVFSFSISAANTWEQKTITITGDTTGTWETGTSAGIKIFISLGAGSTYSGTAGSWGSTAYYGVTSGVNVIGTLNATLDITGVQLETGSVATPFERRSYGQELALCQRYYETGITGGSGGLSYGSGYAGGTVIYSATKRAVPTLTQSNQGYTQVFNNNIILGSTGSNAAANVQGFCHVVINGGSATNYVFVYTAVAEL